VVFQSWRKEPRLRQYSRTWGKCGRGRRRLLTAQGQVPGGSGTMASRPVSAASRRVRNPSRTPPNRSGPIHAETADAPLLTGCRVPGGKASRRPAVRAARGQQETFVVLRLAKTFKATETIAARDRGAGRLGVSTPHKENSLRDNARCRLGRRWLIDERWDDAARQVIQAASLM
jgi:hypothetical protein